MMMAIACNKLSHSESLHKSGSVYKPQYFITSRKSVSPKPFHTASAMSRLSSRCEEE